MRAFLALLSIFAAAQQAPAVEVNVPQTLPGLQHRLIRKQLRFPCRCAFHSGIFT